MPVIKGDKKGCFQSKKTHTRWWWMRCWRMTDDEWQIMSWWIHECYMFAHITLRKPIHCLNVVFFFWVLWTWTWRMLVIWKSSFLWFIPYKPTVRYMQFKEQIKNRGTPKSSILIGFSIINHPFWGTSILGNTHIYSQQPILSQRSGKGGQRGWCEACAASRMCFPDGSENLRNPN